MRTRKRSTRRQFGRDLWHASIACSAVGGLVSLVVLLQSVSPPSTHLASSLDGYNDDLRTGSILFVPIYGNRCRQKFIDNATWRIWDSGVVDCRVAISRSARTQTWSAARLDVVRDGFFKK